MTADPALLIVPLKRLRRLLADDDGEVLDYITEIKPSLTGILTPSEVAILSERIGGMDFEGALAALSEISRRLSLNLESEG